MKGIKKEHLKSHQIMAPVTSDLARCLNICRCSNGLGNQYTSLKKNTKNKNKKITKKNPPQNQINKKQKYPQIVNTNFQDM